MGYRYNAITGELDFVDTCTATSGVNQIDTDAGSIVPAGGIVKIIGGNSITTTGSGNTEVIKNLADVTKYVVDSTVGETAYTTI